MTADKKELFKGNRYLAGMLLTLSFFGLLHCTFVGLFSDDLWFVEMMNAASSLPELLADRYISWTGRLIIEAVCFTLVRLPFFVWCILDVGMCLLLYHSLSVIIVNDKADKSNIWLAVSMAGYPFMHMASAGWISTSLNYLWPFAIVMYVLALEFRDIRGEKVPVFSRFAAIVMYLFAANQELGALYAILTFAGTVCYKRIAAKDKSIISLYEAAIFLLSAAELVFAFTAPGNAIRTETEVRWMMEFPYMSIIDKFRACAVFVFEHFVAIPDAVFFIFSLLPVLAGVGRKKGALKNAVLITPLVIDCGFTAFFFVRDFILGHKSAYDFSYPLIFPEDAADRLLQGCELAGLLIYIAAMTASVMIVFPDLKKRFTAIWALGSGFAVRMSLMLSATMFSSWHRTLIYFYFAMIACSVMMIPAAIKKEKTEASGWIKYLIWVMLTAAVIVNLILTVGHQLRVR